MTSTRYQRPLIALLLAGLLAACGGRDETASETSAKSASPTSTTAPSASSASAGVDGKALQEAAALNRAELERAAAAAHAANGGALASQRKSASDAGRFSISNRVPVIRFYSATQSAHFYTASAAEAQMVRDSLLYMTEEGVAFHASSAPGTGLSPVHRYFNTHSYTHFYTISADEKAYIDAHIPVLRYEGIAFYASQTPGAGWLAVTRFFHNQAGSHFYTRSESEAQYVRDHLSAIYQEEGVGFYVIDPAYVEPPAPPTARLSHSGVTDQQCYEASSNALVACASPGATTLNSEQDGHRTDVNPMSYSEVPKPAGGTFARTECVKDDVTGLIWEGKEASGPRASSNTYTNYDDPTQPQLWDGGAYVNPTPSDIDAATNSVGYVNYVNSIALCGYTDWRRPTVDELLSIVDYGVAEPGPMLETAWFPNAQGGWYWSSSPHVGFAGDAWSVVFSDGYSDASFRSYDTLPVRLVRNTP